MTEVDSEFKVIGNVLYDRFKRKRDFQGHEVTNGFRIDSRKVRFSRSGSGMVLKLYHKY